jgi:hypothetical protein
MLTKKGRMRKERSRKRKLRKTSVTSAVNLPANRIIIQLSGAHNHFRKFTIPKENILSDFGTVQSM